VEEIREIRRNTLNKTRIGILSDPSQIEDLRQLEKPIATLLEKYPEQLEIIVLGLSGKVAEQSSLFKELPIIYHKPGYFTEYFNNINDLELDIGLLPLQDNSFNCCGKGINQFLSYSGLMIPVIASQLDPFTRIIQEGENGLLATTQEEWITRIDQLICDPALRKAIGQNAFKVTWEKMSYTNKALQRLKSIFI
jgi:glycosyltransferase involved in cell wall biosynthesis